MRPIRFVIALPVLAVAVVVAAVVVAWVLGLTGSLFAHP